jgi:peptidoglycan/LPS O-acetylase OafA/YrhL
VLISSKSRLAGLGLFFIILALARHSGNFDARRFLFCFQIGVLLACYPNLVRYMRFPAAFFVGGVALMVYQRVSMIDGGYGGKGTVLEAIASTMMIAAVLTPRSVATFKWLEWAPISFLGRISYSVYLFHLAALFIVAQVLAEIGISELGSPLSQLLLGIGTLALTVPVAWTSYALVEIPAIRWGRIFGNALAATLLVRGDHSSIDPMVERAKIGGDLLDSAR